MVKVNDLRAKSDEQLNDMVQELNKDDFNRTSSKERGIRHAKTYITRRCHK